MHRNHHHPTNASSALMMKLIKSSVIRVIWGLQRDTLDSNHGPSIHNSYLSLLLVHCADVDPVGLWGVYLSGAISTAVDKHCKPPDIQIIFLSSSAAYFRQQVLIELFTRRQVENLDKKSGFLGVRLLFVPANQSLKLLLFPNFIKFVSGTHPLNPSA